VPLSLLVHLGLRRFSARSPLTPTDSFVRSRSRHWCRGLHAVVDCGSVLHSGQRLLGVLQRILRWQLRDLRLMLPMVALTTISEAFSFSYCSCPCRMHCPSHPARGPPDHGPIVCWFLRNYAGPTYWFYLLRPAGQDFSPVAKRHGSHTRGGIPFC